MKKKTKPQLNVTYITKPLAAAFAALRRIISETAQDPYAKKYTIAAVGLFLFFLLITFPFDIFIMSELKKLEGASFHSISADDITIAPFRDLRAKSITLVTLQRGEITLQNPDFSLGTFSLLGKTLSGDYSIESIRYQAENTQMSCNVQGDINLSLDSSGVPVDGDFAIDVKDLAIKGITLQGFSIPPVKITNARGRASVRARTMTINECVIQGRDMNGLIRGTIQFDPVIGRSVMSLTIEISGDSAMLADFKPLLASFINPANGRLSLSVQGAFVNPSVNLVPASGSGPQPTGGRPPLPPR